MVRITRLNRSPKQMVDSVETWLAEKLCAPAGPHAEPWGKLLLVAVARRCGVKGVSFGATLTMSMDEIVDKMSRCLYLLMPDVPAMQLILEEELEKIGARCASVGMDHPPKVDISAILPDSDADQESPPPRRHASAAPAPVGDFVDFDRLFLRLGDTLSRSMSMTQGAAQPTISGELAEVLRRSAEETRRFFDTHASGEALEEEGFTKEEVAFMLRLPRMRADKKSPHMATLRRAVEKILRFAKQCSSDTIPKVVDAHCTRLRSEKKTIALSEATHLAMMVDLFPSLPDDTKKCRAIVAIGEILVLEDEERLQLRLATWTRVTTVPQSSTIMMCLPELPITCPKVMQAARPDQRRCNFCRAVLAATETFDQHNQHCAKPFRRHQGGVTTTPPGRQ